MKNNDTFNSLKPVGPGIHNWINQNLKEPLEIRTGLLHLVLGTFLILCLFLFMVAGVIAGFREYGLSGLSVLIFLGVAGLVAFFYLKWRSSRKTVLKTISPAGVIAKDGSRLDWSHFIGVEYFLVRARTFGPIQVHRVELVFENRRTYFAPSAIKEADRIMEFVYGLPGKQIETPLR